MPPRPMGATTCRMYRTEIGTVVRMPLVGDWNVRESGKTSSETLRLSTGVRRLCACRCLPAARTLKIVPIVIVTVVLICRVAEWFAINLVPLPRIPIRLHSKYHQPLMNRVPLQPCVQMCLPVRKKGKETF